MPDTPNRPGEFLLFQTDDGRTRLDVRLAGDTVWLTQRDIADLFQVTPQNVTQHLATIYAEEELSEEATCKEYLQVRTEGSREVRRQVKHYNLDAILSVGYRVRSHVGTQFRRWATDALKSYVVKGFAVDDDRLKQAGGGDYFDELLDRIRDIRSSERVFWRKVLDIFATSNDYDGQAESAKTFFKTVQNKMHWAVHDQTAAEVIASRADADRPNMGLTSWRGDRARKADVATAKNYLTPEEIDTLNRVVTAYLEFAELQAKARKPMRMADWSGKLDAFLSLTDRDVLTHAGRVTAKVAKDRAESEYAR